jgi:uncharacterized membrane protein YebE (DUF533 family)
MFDAKQILNQFLGAGAKPGSTGSLGGAGLAGSALAGGLAGLVTGTKTGRKIGKKALTYGGTALLGGLAYKAWRDWQQGKQVSSIADSAEGIPEAPTDSAFVPAAGDESRLNRALLLAMIGAAKADGQIDDLEQRRVLQHLDHQGVDEADRAFVTERLRLPLDLEAIVAEASCPETAAEIYAASLIAIDPAGAAEQGYLAMLAARLELPPQLVAHLHANVALAKGDAGKAA